MKKPKKFLCLILAMVILIPNIAIFGNVFAQTTDTEPLKIEVTTDKSSYTAYGIAEITVKVTNTSDEIINNISAEAVFEQLAPVGKNNETFKEIESLQSGESFTFSYKATLNANKVNINFFEKIILWFVRLFNGGYTATSHNIEADTENITEIKFGNYTVQNIVKVGYEETYDEELKRAIENSTYVSNELEEIKNTEEYKSLSIEEKKNFIESKLNDLLSKGEIKNFSYNEINGLFSFEFSSGWRGGTVIEEKHDENCFSSSSSNININNDNDFYSVRNFSVNTLTYGNNTDNWLFIYGADENKSSYNYKHFTQLMNQYEDLGIDITLWDDVNEVTVSSYKNLDNYDLIYIMSHGNYYDTPYICTNEEATEEKKNNYSTELYNNDVEIYDGRFWIKPSFFENNYENDLQNPLILMSCCKALGGNNHKDYRFAKSFEKAGAGAVIGYCNTVVNLYSNSFFEKIIYYITQNYSIGDAYVKSLEIIGKDDNEFYDKLGSIGWKEQPAFPVLYANNQSDKFIKNPLEDNLGGFSAIVKDKLTNNPLENVSVAIYEFTDSEQNLIHFFETDSNGSFFAELPNGKYKCLIHKNNYKDIDNITFEIKNCELVAFLDPILMESDPASVHGTVIDKETRESISNVKVTLYSEDTQATYTTVTDEIGDFSFENLTAGRYTLSFEHEDYTINETNSFTLDEGLMFVFTDPFEFTKKDSTGGDDSGDTGDDSGDTTDPNRTVTASGDCGANGDNATWILYDDGELVISGSGAMADYEFRDAPWYSYKVKKVIINNGIINIGACAFYECYHLAEIIIPDSVTIIDIYAFKDCYSLTEITIPNNVTIIDDYAFFDCYKLTEIVIPISVTTIGNYAFAWCHGLENVNIPYSVTNIGNSPFISKNLKKITVDENNLFFCADNYGVLYNKNKTELIEFPVGSEITEYNIPSGVVSINTSAFSFSGYIALGNFKNSNRTNLKKISIPDSVTNIGDFAFANCNNLTSITIPNGVTSIGESTFENCTSLTNITIPNNVKSIGDSAFRYCTSIVSITIPNGVSTISDYAFMDCTNLTEITIPNSVTEICWRAFSDCENLTDVYYTGTQTQWDNIYIDDYNTYLTNATIHYNS